MTNSFKRPQKFFDHLKFKAKMEQEVKRGDLEGQGEGLAGDSLLETIRNRESLSYGSTYRNQLSSYRHTKNASVDQPSYLKPSGRAGMRTKGKNPFLSSVDAAAKDKVAP